MTALSEADARRVRELRAAGFRPFPMIDKGQPATKWGRLRDADASHDEFERWVSEHKMFAVVCGLVTNLIVIDADSAEAVSFVESHGLRITYRTRRGAHFWVTHPGHLRVIPQSVGERGRGLGNFVGRDDLDVRGDNSIAVAVGGDRTWVD